MQKASWGRVKFPSRLSACSPPRSIHCHLPWIQIFDHPVGKEGHRKNGEDMLATVLQNKDLVFWRIRKGTTKHVFKKQEIMTCLKTHNALVFSRGNVWPASSGYQLRADCAKPSHTYGSPIEKAEPNGGLKSHQEYSQRSFADSFFVCLF